MIEVGYWESPVGWIRIEVGEKGLRRLDYVSEGDMESEVVGSDEGELIKRVKKELEEYFEGKRKKFEIKIEWTIGTEFQRRVWRELLKIPYGQVVSYKDVAERIGNPNAVRAVGGANGKNPMAVVVPCHRVVNANGGLGGYSSGLKIKRKLLDLEGVSRYK